VLKDEAEEVADVVEEAKSPRGSPRASSALRFGKKLRSKVKTAGAAAAKKAASVVSSKNVLVSAPDEASMNMWMEAFTPQAKGNMHFVRRSGMDDTTPAPDDWKPCLGLLYKSQLLLRDIEEYKLFASVALWNVQPGGVKIVEGKFVDAVNCSKPALEIRTSQLVYYLVPDADGEVTLEDLLKAFDKLLATRGEAEIVSAFITEEEQKEASRDAAREMALNATTGNALIDGALFGESEGQATWIGDGVFRGVTGLGKGIITGMSGVVTNTYNGARKDGTQGLVKGLATGVAGLGKNVAGGVVGLGKNVAIGVAATPGMVASTVVDTVDTVSYVAARKDETTAELARLTDEVATLKRYLADMKEMLPAGTVLPDGIEAVLAEEKIVAPVSFAAMTIA